jgi:hypothetical protein
LVGRLIGGPVTQAEVAMARIDVTGRSLSFAKRHRGGG